MFDEENLSLIRVLQQLVRSTFSDSALGPAAFGTQVHIELVICSSGVNVHKHPQNVAATASLVSDLNFIETLRQMLNAKVGLVIWLTQPANLPVCLSAPMPPTF